MVQRTGSATAHVASGPDATFALVTDIGRLPEWNDVIKQVTERPAALAPSAQWCVEVRPPGMPSWTSRSTVTELDAARRRFAYRTQTDDGNPSWADWTWQVDAAPNGGSDVTVTWDLHPETFWRRVLFSRIRNRALQKEVRTSIARLGALAGAG
jgi:hypothetical protein